MSKTEKIVFWISTGLFSAMMVMSATLYFVQHDQFAAVFRTLGYPTYIICPLAIVKYLGIIAIVSNKFGKLTEWAYAGFFFNITLAFFAHFMTDMQIVPPIIAMTLLLTSYFSGRNR